MNKLYPRMSYRTVVNNIRRFGQPCEVLSPGDTGYNPIGTSTGGKKSLCVVCGSDAQYRVDRENPVKLDDGEVKILLISRIQPEKGGAIYANNRYYRIFKSPEEVNPAGLTVLYKVYATDKSQVIPQLYPVDLNRVASVYQRLMRGIRPDEIGEQNYHLIHIKDITCAIETAAAYEQSSGINLNGGVTHILYCRSADIDNMQMPFDMKKHLFEIDGKQYRIEKVKNFNETTYQINLSIE